MYLYQQQGGVEIFRRAWYVEHPQLVYQLLYIQDLES